MSKETVEEVTVISPGAILKAAREKQGLSREEVADQLHLRFTIIKELEDDHYASDISATFTKGYLKLYAKLLGVDEEPVLTAYQNLGSQGKEPAKLQSFSQKVARQASDQRLMWVTYLVLVLVVAGVVAWWIQQDDTSLSRFIDGNVSIPMDRDDSASDNSLPNNSLPNNSPPNNVLPNDKQTGALDSPSAAESKPINTSTQAPAATAPSDPADALPEELSFETQPAETQPAQSAEIASSETADPETASTVSDSDVAAQTPDAQPVLPTVNNPVAILPSETEGGEEPANTSADQDNNSTSTAAVTSEAVPNLPLADPVELVFTFSGDCWMKLTDATGEDVAYGVKQSGRVMPVSGVPPFEVVLGAPESVQISYAGTPVDMARFRPGYTARFQLPLSE